MTVEEIANIVATRKACVMRENNGHCDRQCSTCQLAVSPDKTLAAMDKILFMLVSAQRLEDDLK